MRALKIHHRERLKKKRKFYFGRDLTADPKALGMVVDTPTPCSCPGCGNDRPYEGKTRAEKAAYIDMLEYDI